jgi:hypothetical protein
VIRLRGGEVGERPDVRAHDVLVPPGLLEQPLEEGFLVLLGPHGRRVRVAAGNRVRAELGQHDRLAPGPAQPVQRAAEGRRGLVEPARMPVPAGVAVQEDDVGGLQARRVRQVGGVPHRPRAVQRSRRVAQLTQHGRGRGVVHPRLVGDRPGDDAGPVAVPRDELGEEPECELLSARQVLAVEVEPHRRGLRDHQQAELVGDVEGLLVARVVRGAKRVRAELAHE